MNIMRESDKIESSTSQKALIEAIEKRHYQKI